jgi:RNase P subunit RPR2
MIKCPNCKQILKEGEYEMVSAYHNTNDYVCFKCGYEGHWMSFKRT